jgi:acyl-CoA dehydrogenase
MEYSLSLLLHRAENALDEFLQNLPNRAVAVVLRALTMPLGRRWDKPHDDLSRSLARAISTDSPVRSKLLESVWTTNGEGNVENPVARYNGLLKDYEKAESLYRKVTKAYAKGQLPMTALHPEERFEEALKADIFSKEEADFMRQYETVVLEMLTVDDFPFDAFASNKSTVIDHNPA